MNSFIIDTTLYKGDQRYRSVTISLFLVVYVEKGKAQIKYTYEEKSCKRVLSL